MYMSPSKSNTDATVGPAKLVDSQGFFQGNPTHNEDDQILDPAREEPKE